MPAAPPLFGLAMVLAAGIVGGELAFRARLPRVTGWIATGLALRAATLPGLGGEDLARFAPFTDFVLGYIAFTVGAALRRKTLRNAESRLAFLVLAEAVVTPAAVAAALHVFARLDWPVAWVLGAIAVAGAPGTTVVVVQEARARGVFTKTLLAAVPLIDVVAVAVFAFVLATLHDATGAGWTSALASVGAEMGKAAAVGVGVALAVLAGLSTIIGPAFLGPAMVTAIVASWGIAELTGASSILSCTFCGVAVGNMQHYTARATKAYLQPFGGVLFAGFFTFAGMRLDFAMLPPLLGPVLVFVAARVAGKAAAAYGAMTLSRMPGPLRRYLGLAFWPHGGVAVGLILLVLEDPRLAAIHDTVATVGLAALAINQLAGPFATKIALARTGETGKNRPRLLDFLSEEHIVVPLEGRDATEVIARLVDHLDRTHHLPVSKEVFLQRVLAREAEAPTLLGHGLMIPHGELASGRRIRGVLGISPEGLDLGAPDGEPVHAVFLLATPPDARDRHLEVLSALASTFARDPTLREQLFRAKNAAHAYRVLHAEDAAFNDYLDGVPPEPVG